MKKIYFVLIMLSCQLSFAQDLKFGDVTKAELLETSYALDSSANAAILYKYRKSYFDIDAGGAKIITEVQQRIKIYNQQGFEYATSQIDLFKSGSARESMGKIKAYTYNLENDKIVKSELEKDQIFKNERSRNFNEVKFTMPNIKEGSVIEFKYRISSPFYSSLDDLLLQYDIPIRRIEAHIKTPKGLVFKPTTKGYISFFPKRSTSQSSRIDMTMIEYSYALNNVPALKDEIYVDNIDNYRAGVMFELVSIDLPGYVESFASTWEDVAKTIGSSDDYKKQLNKSKAFKDEIDPLISDVPDKKDKMKLIFKYVKDNVKWNGSDSKYFRYGMKKTLKEKKGSAGDINLMLVAMLRYSGIEANPVVISTKENSIPFFPTLDRLNYVIAHAVIDEKTYFMDATDEFSDINLLPIKDYNWQGILINNSKEEWKQIDIAAPNQAVAQYQIIAKLSEDGSIEGTYNSKLTDHYSYQFKESIKDQDLDAFIAERENDYDDIEISNYEIKNIDTYEGIVRESFSYYQENGAEALNDKLFIKPLTFLRMAENPFKLETREFPIDFGYAFKDMYIVNIEIPEGYQIESPIAPFRGRTPDGNAEFKYLVSTVGNKIQISASFNINKAIQSADTYLVLKEFFNLIINKEAEQIVLKKVRP